MDYIQKIKLLNELMLNATPQNVDFTPQNGNYCVALIATRPVHTWGYQKRNFKIKGRLEEGKTVSADLIAENEMLFGVEDLPYVAHEGDPYLQDNSCFHFLCLCGVATYRPALGDAEDCLVRLSFQETG